ncbi:hypothetical protein PV326_005045 [Microctonus aethiopoides]|nr:hypothetical protein PV326_005045 [Microctonus aethiopoides]
MEFNDLLLLLRQLRDEKVNGKLDEDEFSDESKLWRNRLDYHTIEMSIKSSYDEIKLEVLGLLVQSKKSTLRFTPKELELIFIFIKLNLGEALDFVPLIKKAFKRLKESLAVFHRNVMQPEKFKTHKNKVGIDLNLYQQLEEEYNSLAIKSRDAINIYRIFIIDVRNECLNGICCGATHTRKKNSLSILQLEQEILFDNLKESPWNEIQANKLFQCLLMDTYEVNKDIAFKIITKIKPSLLKLEDSIVVHEIVDVALKLANSVRPIDSITALYMLRICLMSPIISDTLKQWSTDNIQDPTLQLINLILDHLKDPTKLANENIIAAVAKHSLYGYIYCINGLISSYNFRKITMHQAWLETVADIIRISLSLNTAISVVVNNSSPEGHFPMDFERKFFNDDINDSDLATVTPQMVLLCSWRTVKEVSLLFGLLATKCPIENESTELGLICEKQIIDIGSHLVTLLSETKHRGAFEQAHIGFEKLCSRLWHLKQKHLQQLPKIWLYDLLLAITGSSSGNSKLCATRRSAGVPFMVQALIASEPSVKSKTGAVVFHSVMRILLALVQLDDKNEFIINATELISKEDFFHDYREISTENYSSTVINTNHSSNCVTLSEVKTHALNVLRALFKHAQLGDFARAYAADGLIVAIKNYNEKTWAERNAATLLFSALITRIFGVQRSKDYVNLSLHNKMTGRIFFEKYPKLLPFMLDELKLFNNDCDGSIRPSVQSILLLLSRLYVGINPDNNTEINWENNEFVKLVSGCAKSRIYTTRELAARAVVPLLTEKTVGPFINGLFESIQTEAKNNIASPWNIIHGYMLQALEIVKSSLLKSCDLFQIRLAQFITESRWIINNLSADNNKPACFPLAAAYIDFLDEFMNLYKIQKEILPYNSYHQVLMETITYINNDKLKNRPGREIFESSMVKFIIKWGLIINNEYSLSHNQLLHVWKIILTHPNDQIQILGWTYLIETIHSQEIIDSKKELYNFAINQAIKQSTKCYQNLQSAIYEFLYQVFIDYERQNNHLFSIDFMNEIWNTILCNFSEDISRINASSLKLLGKTFGLSFKYNFYKPIDKWIQHSNCKLYEVFLNNSWTSSADSDCRLAIAKVIHDIYIDIKYLREKDAVISLLDWWTIVLRLLVDDSAEIRSLASIVVCKMEPLCDNNCVTIPLYQFFYKFSKKFYDDRCARFAAYFYWSLSLSGDDYQMDDSDVFNKFYNYEAYEPLRIFNYCEQYTKDLFENEWNVDCNFSFSLQKWVSGKLDMTLEDCTTAKTMINSYGLRLSVLENNLYDLLDPTYNDKMLQTLIFKKFQTFIDENCDTCQ